MIVKAKIRTNQRSFSVVKGDVWLISLKSLPEKNMANQELVKELSKIYKKVRIVSGLRSKNKVLELG